MPRTLAEVKVRVMNGEPSKSWTIDGERITSLTNFLDWAEGQRELKQKRAEISRRVRAKARKGS